MKILILSDSRLGGEKQSIALAKLLGLEYYVLRIKFNFLAILPNWLKYGWCDVEDKSKDEILNFKPDLIISAGRRAGRIAALLKRQFPQVKAIQIMRPELSYKAFDLVILPYHDLSNPDILPSDNVVLINGSLVDVANTEDQSNEFLFSKHAIPPVIALFIGGPSRSVKFDLASFKELMDLVIGVTKDVLGSFIITTSRRTPDEFIRVMEDKLSASGLHYYIYDFNNKMASYNYSKKTKVIENNNPYYHMVNMADYVVATPDSISLCSELRQFGKPFFLLYKPAILSTKHQTFVTRLVEEAGARILQDKFTDYTPIPDDSFVVLKARISKLLGI